MNPNANIVYRLEVCVDGRWVPAVQGTLNQTGLDDDDASTFTSHDEALEARSTCELYGFPDADFRVVEIEPAVTLLDRPQPPPRNLEESWKNFIELFREGGDE